MSEAFARVLETLLARLSETEANSDRIADLLSDHAIYIEELGEEERALVDGFLQDAFALWEARKGDAQGATPHAGAAEDV